MMLHSPPLRFAFVMAFALVCLCSFQRAFGASRPTALYDLQLASGKRALVFANGLATIFGKDNKHRTQVMYRTFPVAPKSDDVSLERGLPDKAHLAFDLSKAPQTSPYVDNRIIIVFQQNVGVARAVQVVPHSTIVAMQRAHTDSERVALAHPYTSDTATNVALTTLGVDRMDHLFARLSGTALANGRAQAGFGRSTLDIAKAYRLHLTGASVRAAVSALAKLPGVLYVAPDWRVGPMSTPAITLPQSARASSVNPLSAPLTAALAVPTNFALRSSAQSLLNAPSTNAVAAMDEIGSRFHELPGTGEIVTNVSLGDLDVPEAASNPNDPCQEFVNALGATTRRINGQMYIDWPSMPLIAAYSADVSGNLDGSTEVCGIDPFLGEVGLDFSMMAPLPHDRQRAGERGSGFTDLLGIAPGATYRLVVPRTLSDPGNSDIVAALLGAAQQVPRPSVITASLGFAYDQFGFSGRYLEDDPLTQAAIAAIVNNYNIVVCISAGDGTRLFTNAAIGPSGGSTPTNTVAPGGNPTMLSDVGFSSVPSRDFDSGAIDVGGTTLDDIFAAPPQNEQLRKLAAQHAFAETRWTGFTNFSSGFGSRVNVSAPADNVLGFSHHPGGAFDAVDLNINGGTSASAPEVAAAAAVALQVARRSGHPFHQATDVRAFLARTGAQVPRVPQSDIYNEVGPQVDVTNAVETLLHAGGHPVEPAVVRIAVEQRRNAGNLDGVFVSDTDPANIDLLGPVSNVDGSLTGRNQTAWITIAPDWEGLPRNAQFRLNVVGRYAFPLATTRWARLSPEQILHAAGLPLVSGGTRNVKLRYRAFTGMHLLAERIFSMTFGPAVPTTRGVLAPLVPTEVHGASIPVTYDIKDARNVQNPTLLVSEPGRFDPATGFIFHPAFSKRLTSLRGTVEVPLSALHGAGVYGVGLLLGTITGTDPNTGLRCGCPFYSDFAFTRVAAVPSARPAAPLLSTIGATSGHSTEIPYGVPLRVSWDVSNVPGATGASLEISAGGPTPFSSYNLFNNPNGSVRDHNGLDFGSVYIKPLSGVSGVASIDPVAAGVIPTLNHVVRIIPIRGGMAAGEAGEVSSLTMDGVMPTVPGGAQYFGVNPSGNVGYVTPNYYDASFTIHSAVQTFDQRTNRIAKTDVLGTPGADLFFTSGGGMYPNDITVMNDFNVASGTVTKSVFNVGSGKTLKPWTPPAVASDVFEDALDTTNDNGAFVAQPYNFSTKQVNFFVFQSHVSANTFGPVHNVTAWLHSLANPDTLGFAQDTATNTALLVAEDLNQNFCGAPFIVATKLSTGATTSFTGLGMGVQGVAIDSATRKMAVPSFCDGVLGIYDLATKRGFAVPLPSGQPGSSAGAGLYTAADPKHHLFLVMQAAPADFAINNNALGSVLVYDERGALVSQLERFGFLNQGFVVQNNGLQLNFGRRTGYIYGSFGQQLEPFKY